MPRPLLVAAAAVALAIAVASCADDGPAADPSPAPSPGPPPAPTITVAAAVDAPVAEPVHVQSLDNTFRPEVVEVTVGTEVVWTNVGRNDHDVTPSDGSTTWGVDADGFGPGAEYRHTFTEPGEYPYFCSIHGTAEVGQLGTIIVTAASSD